MMSSTLLFTIFAALRSNVMNKTAKSCYNFVRIKESLSKTNVDPIMSEGTMNELLTSISARKFHDRMLVGGYVANQAE
jgi:hypothetical protein